MAKIVVDRPGVPPIVGQLVAARVTQHMAADLEREARRLSSPRNHPLVTCHAQGCQALGGEHVEPRLSLPLQAAQGAEFAVFQQSDFVQAGGFMSYGPNIPDLFRRAAEVVDRILRGTKPGDIPVEQPTKFELVINLTTAKAIGIDFPPTFLARADEVIE